MYTGRKDISALALPFAFLFPVVMAAAHLTAQSPLDSKAAPATPPPSTSIFPLDQVHRGEHGIAYTVYEGTKPEAMDVEVLGVLHHAIGPRQDMILVRLQGAKPDYSGVVAGMSGSPVYIDGRLAGALAYRIGEFSKEPIAGVTPIEQMLQVRDEASTAPKTDDGAGAASPGPDADRPSGPVKPIDTPLVFSGFSPAAVALWKAHAPNLGLSAVAGVGGSSTGDEGAMAAHPTMTAETGAIEPGSAVSAVLVRGDLEIAATCTVTYVDPKRLLACGHPITQFGPVSIPMTAAEVIATLPSPLDAFKIINTAETIGSFTQDRETAISGEFGVPAHMIPLTMRLTQQGQRPSALHLELIDQEQLTPAAVMVSVFQGLMQSNHYAAETTYRIKASVKLAGYPAVEFEDLVAPTDVAPANLAAALMLGSRFSSLYENAARHAAIEDIRVDVNAVPGRQTVAIEGAEAEKTELRGGQTVIVEAQLRPWRGELRSIRIPVVLPASLPSGPVRLLLSDGPTLDRMQHPATFGATPDIAATIAELNSLHATDRLYVTLLAPDPQASIDGRTLTAFPISMANVLEPVRANRGMNLNGESAVPLASVPLDAVLSGQQVLTLRVE